MATTPTGNQPTTSLVKVCLALAIGLDDPRFGLLAIFVVLVEKIARRWKNRS